jgi:hypothetical protein
VPSTIRLSVAERGPVSGEDVSTREHQLDRPVEEFGGGHRERDMGPGGGLAAETAADERRKHAHPTGGQPELLGQHLLDPVGVLGRVVDGEVAVLPAREGGMGFDRAVMRERRGVGGVDSRGRLAQRGRCVAPVGPGPFEQGVRWGERRPACRLGRDRQRRRPGVGGVAHVDQRRGEPRLLEGLGYHDRDWLAGEVDLVGVEDRQAHRGRAERS